MKGGNTVNYHDQYQLGYYQQVYDELLALGERVFDPDLYDDALVVARTMMRRVRTNLEGVLIPRLKQFGYRFGDGAWDHPDVESDEELLLIQQEYPIFQAPSHDVASQIAELEQLVGPLPLTLKCWYKEVGTVNLIGSFPASESIDGHGYYKRGYGLDPLHSEPLENALAETRYAIQYGNWQDHPMLSFSPDGELKYDVSGSGCYEIALPCKAFDGLLLGEPHDMTFANYLRLCFRWAGCPGLEDFFRDGKSLLTEQELDFLTKDLLPF